MLSNESCHGTVLSLTKTFSVYQTSDMVRSVFPAVLFCFYSDN